MKKGDESTYRCLAAAEEKTRDCLETGIYAVFLISGLLAIGQFAVSTKPWFRDQHFSAHRHPHKSEPVPDRSRAV